MAVDEAFEAGWDSCHWTSKLNQVEHLCTLSINLMLPLPNGDQTCVVYSNCGHTRVLYNVRGVRWSQLSRQVR